MAIRPRWLNAHVFTSGMVDGWPWHQIAYGTPYLLQNCHIERGAIRTRNGHTSAVTATSKPILADFYEPTTYYGAINDSSIGKIGRWETGVFTDKNIYSTGTVTVSGNTVTFAGAADMTKRIAFRSFYKFRYIYTGSTYSSWLTISSVDSSTQITVASAPGNITGATYQLLIDWSYDYGDMIRMGDRYILTVKGGPPVVYDTTLGKCWHAGIPVPEPPTGSYGALADPNDGYYAYAVSVVRLSDNAGSANISSRLVVQATDANYAINLTMDSTIWEWGGNYKLRLWRTTHQATSGAATSATLYFLTDIQINGGNVKYTDTAYDANVDSTTTWSAGTIGLLTPQAPSGVFEAPEGDTGWYAYAIAYKLTTGEIGPLSKRLVVQKSTLTHNLTLTLPAQLDFTNGFEVYRSAKQDSQKDANDPETELYLLPVDIYGTSCMDTGDDNILNYLKPAPVETAPWNDNNNMRGLLYFDGRAWMWGDGNKVYASGLVDEDITVGRGTGRDEPNYWTLDYDAGMRGEYVKAGAVYRDSLYILTNSCTYLLDQSGGNANYWFMVRITNGVGCGHSHAACAGNNGIYTIHTGTDGKNRMYLISPTGIPTYISHIQTTIDACSAFYRAWADNGKINISTDTGIIVFNEVDGTWNIDTGVTVRSVSVGNNNVYAGDATGVLYTLYSKAAGTAGDEGAYTWKVRSGAFTSGLPENPCAYERFWVRILNTNTNATTLYAKVSHDKYSTYVQTTQAGGADWSETISATGNGADYLKEYTFPKIGSRNTAGLELYGTGGYGKLAITGYGMSVSEPVLGDVGESSA